jgi:hypothetical protein
MRYYFTSDGLCRAIVTEDPLGQKPGLYADYIAVLDGDAGRDPANSINEGGVLRNKNNITIVADASPSSSGYIQYHISTATYWPARILVNGIAYTISTTAAQQVGGFSAGQAVTVQPNPAYANGNNVTCYAYDPCSCSCCNGG